MLNKNDVPSFFDPEASVYDDAVCSICGAGAANYDTGQCDNCDSWDDAWEDDFTPKDSIYSTS